MLSVMRNSFVFLLMLNYRIMSGIIVSVGMLWIIWIVELSVILVVFDSLVVSFSVRLMLLLIVKLNSVCYVFIFMFVYILFDVMSD